MVVEVVLILAQQLGQVFQPLRVVGFLFLGYRFVARRGFQVGEVVRCADERGCAGEECAGESRGVGGEHVAGGGQFTVNLDLWFSLLREGRVNVKAVGTFRSFEFISMHSFRHVSRKST